MEIAGFETVLGSVETPAELWEIVVAFFGDTPVTRLVYHHLPPLGAPDLMTRVGVATHGIPDAVRDIYVGERLYRFNPALRQALSSVEPFYFDEVSPKSEDERAFLAAVHNLDFQYGIGLQVFGPNGRNGYCGLGLTAELARLPETIMRDYQWVCQLAHLRYCAMVQEAMGPPPRLSGREAEVLGWVARGKSNGTIGEILGISAHTVDAHLRRIYLKLGVFDRISAAIRGLGIGLIQADL